MQNIPNLLQQHPELKTNLEKAVHEIFLKVDKEICTMAFMEVSVLLYFFLNPFFFPFAHAKIQPVLLLSTLFDVTMDLYATFSRCIVVVQHA
jgi:hypothetical protein